MNFLGRAKQLSLKAFFWLIAISLGLIDAWTSRHDLDFDIISYLDLADAYARGSWAETVNAFWSPLYPALLGIVQLVLGPTTQWEFLVVRLVNVAILVGALASFDFFLRELIRHQRARVADAGVPWSGFPEWAFVIAGYSLAIWASVALVEVSYGAGDMCVEALVFVAAGLLLRMRLGVATWRTFAALGAILGVGYLAKAAMFPLAFVFVPVAVLCTPGRPGRPAIRNAIAAVLAFVAVAGPHVLLISHSKGRFTFGDSGKLNYAWHVSLCAGATPCSQSGYQRHWQGGPPLGGTPAHPTRQLFDHPPVYEFASPVGGTYPPWFDPSYWYEGVEARFSPKQQALALRKNLIRYFEMCSLVGSSLLAVLVVVYHASGRGRAIVDDVLQYWALIVPALAALGLYALVHVEPRYVAGYIVVLALCLLASIRLPEGPGSRRLFQAVTAVCVVASLISTAARMAYPVGFEVLRPAWWDASPQVARTLERLGIGGGDAVACIGTGVGGWARLARVRIVAEIPGGQQSTFWAADDSTRERILQSFEAAGARVALAKLSPEAGSATGWNRIADTDYVFHLLKR